MVSLPKVNQWVGKEESSELTGSTEINKPSNPSQFIEMKNFAELPHLIRTHSGSGQPRRILTQEEEFEQIKKCRYIRRNVKQQEKEDINLDISFLSEESRNNNKNTTGNLKIEKMGLSKQNSKHSLNMLNFLKEEGEEKKGNKCDFIPAIQPFVPRSLNRDKMEPLSIQFADKCSVGSPKYNNNVSVTDLKTNSKVEKLYKEVHVAAENAQVDLATVSRDVKSLRGSMKKKHLLQKSHRKWMFLRGLVRSGWLLGKKGRNLKLMESRRRKRMLAEKIDLQLLISRTKKNHAPLKERYIKQKLMKNNRLPPLNF